MRRILPSFLHFFFVPLGAVFLAAPLARADEWPQWRGPQRDGVWRETGVLTQFDAPALPVLWRVPISNGYSGPTVAQGRVYVTDRLTSPSEVERVLCFDAMTGERVWARAYDCVYEGIAYPDGPRASVTVEDSRAYSLGTMAHFFCLGAADGRVLWSKDLRAEYHIKMPQWGISCSPLIEEDQVIVQIGGRENACVVAFDKTSGKEKWRALDDDVSYSSPIVIEQAGKRVLVCWTGSRVAGLDPRTGELYWQAPFQPRKYVDGIVTPVFENNYLFVSSFNDGSLLLKVNPDALEVREVWRRKGVNERQTDAIHCLMSTPLLLGDAIYGVDSYGELRCLDLLSGDRIWESLAAVPPDRWANIHLVRNGNRVWMFNDRGELIICRLSREGFAEIGRVKLIKPTPGQLNRHGGVCWSHPAFAYKRIYARNDEELLCADLSARVEPRSGETPAER